jgi:hypothetical protein
MLMVEMQTSQAMLLEATRKLIELRDNAEWATQLPTRCPPVLWFGNATSSKPKVVTIGANPSRKEFLWDSSAQAMEKVRRSGDQSLLSYREPPDHRFRVLSANERLADVLISEELQEEILTSYNTYFAHNPYKAWFGHNREDSYYVEGFLRGFGASYYEGNAVPQQAIHIDLFPFATLDDFVRIKEMANAAFFADGWAQRLISELVEFLSPAVLVLFGRTNCKHFGTYVDRSVSSNSWQSFASGYYFVGRSKRFDVPVVGLSTNLGNPIGFTASGLRAYGKHLRQLVDEAIATK